MRVEVEYFFHSGLGVAQVLRARLGGGGKGARVKILKPKTGLEVQLKT